MGLFGLGAPEIAVIVVAGGLLLGKDQLSNIARGAGEAAAELKEGLEVAPSQFQEGQSEAELGVDTVPTEIGGVKLTSLAKVAGKRGVELAENAAKAPGDFQEGWKEAEAAGGADAKLTKKAAAFGKQAAKIATDVSTEAKSALDNFNAAKDEKDEK